MFPVGWFQNTAGYRTLIASFVVLYHLIVHSLMIPRRNKIFSVCLMVVFIFKYNSQAFIFHYFILFSIHVGAMVIVDTFRNLPCDLGKTIPI